MGNTYVIHIHTHSLTHSCIHLWVSATREWWLLAVRSGSGQVMVVINTWVMGTSGCGRSLCTLLAGQGFGVINVERAKYGLDTPTLWQDTD